MGDGFATFRDKSKVVTREIATFGKPSPKWE